MNSVRLEVVNRVAHIVFDQPGSRANTLSSTVWNELGNAISEIDNRNDILGLILASGKDGIFLAGADIRELYTLPIDEPGPIKTLLHSGLRVLKALEGVPFPTAAAIDGACLGGGLEVAMACDYRLAGTHPKVKIGLPEVKLGLIPGWAGTQRLPRLIGVERAVEMLVRGSSLGADAAKDVGLVDAVIPSDQLLAAAADIVVTAKEHDWDHRRAIKRGPVASVARVDVGGEITTLPVDEQLAAATVLRVVQQGITENLDSATEIETLEFIPLLASPAARRRIESFLRK